MSLYPYLLFSQFFSKPTSNQVEILRNAESRYDRDFVRVSFLSHFIIYLLLFLPPFQKVYSVVISTFFLVTFFRGLMWFVFYLPKQLSGFWIFCTNTLADALLFIGFIMAIRTVEDLTTVFLMNLYLMTFILPILLYSLRLRAIETGVYAVYISVCYFVYISFIPTNLFLEFPPVAKYILIYVYLGTGILGVLFVVHRRRDVLSIHSLSEEKRVIQQDLDLAKRVQDALFPGNISIPGLKFTFYRKNPNTIGGDFFDFVQLREGNVGVFLTDVAGHGISSAMVASIMKVLVSTIPYRYKTAPAKLMEYLDERLAKDLNRYHASAIYLFFDFVEKRVTLGNAGHPYLIVSEPGSDFMELETEGPILGFNIKVPSVLEKSMPLKPGMRFFVYTDGLIESTDRKGDSLGTEGLLSLLNRHRHNQTLTDLENSLLLELRGKYGLDHFSDDTMFLILEVEE